MAHMVFDLSSVEAKTCLREFVAKALKERKGCDDLILRTFRVKALEMDVHKLDFEAIVNTELDRLNKHTQGESFGILCPRCDAVYPVIVPDCTTCGWRFSLYHENVSDEDLELDQMRISIAREVWNTYSAEDVDLEKLLTGNGTEEEDKEALSWLKRDALLNKPEALSLMGEAYLYGYGLDEEESRALELLKQAADKNVPRALYNLGEMYRYGYGVDEDEEEALRWYEKGLRHGDKDSRIAIEEIRRERKERLTKEKPEKDLVDPEIFEAERCDAQLTKSESNEAEVIDNKNIEMNGDKGLPEVVVQTLYYSLYLLYSKFKYVTLCLLDLLMASPILFIDRTANVTIPITTILFPLYFSAVFYVSSGLIWLNKGDCVNVEFSNFSFCVFTSGCMLFCALSLVRMFMVYSLFEHLYISLIVYVCCSMILLPIFKKFDMESVFFGWFY